MSHVIVIMRLPSSQSSVWILFWSYFESSRLSFKPFSIPKRSYLHATFFVCVIIDVHDCRLFCSAPLRKFIFVITSVCLVEIFLISNPSVANMFFFTTSAKYFLAMKSLSFFTKIQQNSPFSYHMLLFYICSCETDIRTRVISGP